MRKVLGYLHQTRKLADYIIVHCFQWLSDTKYVRLRYRCLKGKRLDLESPQTFQEKIQWLKLYDHKPEYSVMVDKVLVKQYVSSIVGAEYVIPLLGVWDKPEEIDWDILPNKFVLKTNHSGGNSGVLICRDKNAFNREEAISRLNFSLNDEVYKNWREWPYKNIKKKVFAEEFVESHPEVNDLPDYKWYCFNGEPRFCQVIKNRSTKETIDFFDTNWVKQEFIGLNPKACHSIENIPQPDDLEVQLQIAKLLSKDIPFVRIDLYSVGGRTFFGEITFYPMSGMGDFNPAMYNRILGNMLVLPTKNE